jgi:hypothetical protein
LFVPLDVGQLSITRADVPSTTIIGGAAMADDCQAESGS